MKQVVAAAVAGPAAAAPNDHAGSAKLRHRNHKVKAWKALFAPNRPMTLDECQHVRRLADEEWDSILRDPDEHEAWVKHNATRSRQSKAARRGGDGADGHRPNGRRDFKGLWTGHSDPTLLFSAADTMALAAPAGEDETALVAGAPAAAGAGSIEHAPQRCVAKGEGWGPLWGCRCKVQNVCRAHGLLRAGEAGRLNARLKHINSWVRGVGRNAADEVNSFALFVTASRGPHGSPLNRICLLSDCIWSPYAQLLTSCHLREDPRALRCFDAPAPPFRLRIGASAFASRFRGAWRAFWTSTSDEYALELVRDADQWQLFPLVCVPDADSDSLRDCIVTEVGAEIPMPRARAHALAAQQDAEAALLGLSDNCPSALAGPAGAAESPPSADDGDSGAGQEWEESSLESYAPSDVEAVAEDAQEAFAAAEDLFDPSPSDALDGEAGGGDPPGPPAEGAPPEETFSSADCSLLAQIHNGHVTCPLPPWADMGHIGTLTDWPAHLEEKDRSWSMKCLVHRRKCAIVRTRRKVSEDMMLR